MKLYVVLVLIVGWVTLIKSGTGEKDTNYVMIDTGSCDSHGFELVESKDECEEAAKFLNLEDTTAHASQTSGRPHGCIYASNNWLSWYSPLAPSAFYSPPAPCGVDFGSAGPYGKHEMIFSCICRTGEVEVNCKDKDYGKTDKGGDSCASWYSWMPGDCGKYDDDDFTANTMCCACKAEANCMDTDNGATDSNGESCAYWYRWYPKDCGLYDDDDFTAKTMCCACKE